MRYAALTGAILLAACQPSPDPIPANIVPAAADFVLVDKSDRTLTLYYGGALVKTYRNIGFGDAPAGHKRFEGDERTPEGRYIIDARNPDSAYHLSLRISYPNAQDRAFAQAAGGDPGGNIFIHGQPNVMRDLGPDARIAGDWTNGCIAVSNAEITELWNAIPDGTQIHIQP
ncbi:L,D-transpeptidase family protein [Pontixanthobacter sp.]|uniref:L,D-transpeptidase family protein n=1 Tax=Pontixanthobacter sp. TaxID=2792078 RepID=UPI003C7B02D2